MKLNTKNDERSHRQRRKKNEKKHLRIVTLTILRVESRSIEDGATLERLVLLVEFENLLVGGVDFFFGADVQRQVVETGVLLVVRSLVSGGDAKAYVTFIYNEECGRFGE